MVGQQHPRFVPKGPAVLSEMLEPQVRTVVAYGTHLFGEPSFVDKRPAVHDPGIEHLGLFV